MTRGHLNGRFTKQFKLALMTIFVLTSQISGCNQTMEKETVLVDGEKLTRQDVEQKISELLFVEKYPEEQFAVWKLREDYIYYCQLIGLDQGQVEMFNEYLSNMLADTFPELKIECSQQPEQPVSMIVLYMNEDETQQFSEKFPKLGALLGEETVSFIQDNKPIKKIQYSYEYVARYFDISAIKSEIFEPVHVNTLIRDSISLIFPSIRQVKLILQGSKLKEWEESLLKNYYSDQIKPGSTVKEALPILTDLVFGELKQAGA